MHNLFSFFILIFPLYLFAAPPAYQIQIQFSDNGKPDSKLSVVVQEGKTGSVVSTSEDKQTFFEATPVKAAKNNDLRIKMVVGYILKDGSRNIISSHFLNAKIGQPEHFIWNDKNNKMDLEVTATPFLQNQNSGSKSLFTKEL